MAEMVEVVRCKDCKHNADNGGDCDRVLIHTHRNLITETNEYQYFKLNYCEYGTPKERGADKPKITCLNCKHLMFSDMYGECNKQLRIVNPSDTCEYAEPKERGVDK